MTRVSADELELCRQVRAMCAFDRLRRSARGITQVYEAAVPAGELKATQMPILVGLAVGGDQPITTLADNLGLDRTTLTRNLSVLAARGFVRTAEHEDDARMRIVSLTPEGSQALSGALARWREVQAGVEERFGAERLRALYGELDALSAAVSAGG
jgi:DNA-binding MarR family transcriptional regulator